MNITGQSAFRGLLAFFIILLMMPLGHAFVVLMERHLDGIMLKLSAFLLGFLGIVIAVVGNRLKGEAMCILAGAFGAILLWGGWVEFIYISYGRSLSVPALMNGGEILTKPEYRMMPSALPFAIITLIMYTWWIPSNWGAIRIFRKWLGIRVPEKWAGKNSESMSTFINLLLLIWWAYLILLVEFDRDILGESNPITLGFAALCLCVAVILLIRSLKSPTWGSALRQAIVTVCVLWTFVEVMIKVKLFTEIWIYPEHYIVEMILIVVAFVVAIFVMAYLGHSNLRKTKKSTDEC